MEPTRITGYDTHGNPVRIGDIDTDGYRVGYIDREGLAHESLAEAELSQCAGRFHDAYVDWERGDGPKPSMVEFCRRYAPHVPLPRALGDLVETEFTWAMLRSVVCDVADDDEDLARLMRQRPIPQ